MSDKLKHDLEEVHNELKRIHSEDPKLKQLAGDVQVAIDQTGEIPHALQQSFAQITEEFETRHPELTALINNVMTSLSNLGI